MFRSSQLVMSACLLGTHRSLLMMAKHTQKFGRSVCNNTLSQEAFMITRARGQQCKQPDKHEPQTNIWNLQDHRHESRSCTVNTKPVNSAHPTQNVTAVMKTVSTNFLSQPVIKVSLQNLSGTAPIKHTVSELFTLRDSGPNKCPLENQPIKHKMFDIPVDKCRTNLITTIKEKKYYQTMMRHTSFKGGFSRTYELSRTLWTPYVENLINHGILITQTCGLHKQAPQQATVMDCLSSGNEARCRNHLKPNAALYKSEKGKSWAAVLVSLCTAAGEPSLLFTLRSSKLRGRHKGDVSFAGGKRDLSDKNVVDTALREAQEELGITVPENKVWGVLNPLRDQSGMMIAPVLANLGPLESLTFHPNPSEVEEIFTLTVAHLCSPQNRGYTHFRTGDRYGYTLPVFHNTKYRVWGLTAVALDHTLKLLVPTYQQQDLTIQQPAQWKRFS